MHEKEKDDDVGIERHSYGRIADRQDEEKQEAKDEGRKDEQDGHG